MAAMSTALTVFSTIGNTRTYTYTGHTVADPHIVVQRRKVPPSSTGIAEDTVTVISATQDADGVTLDSKDSIEIKVRRPVNGVASDMTALLAVARDIMASDEMTAVTTTQSFVKA